MQNFASGCNYPCPCRQIAQTFILFPLSAIIIGMEKTAKKILLSGVKPTGRPHIGNYFGAMRQFVELQEKYESYIFIADLHALTTIQNAAELRQNIIDVALDYLAIGLDPKKITLFKQSDIPEVAELAWIFNCITTVPYLMRSHAFKAQVDKVWANYMDARGLKTIDEYLESRKKDSPKYDDEVERMFSGINVGILDYPMLMAADILIQDADVVPVGADQKQHVEYARDTAEKFNRVFSSTGSEQAVPVFKLPDALILDSVKVVPGTDGQKMSKSYNNIIPLFATDEEIEKAVMGIVTDSSGGVPKNVFEIHKLFRPESELSALYQSKVGKYKDLKEALIADIKKFIKPLRDRREKLAGDPVGVLKILKSGGEKAKKVAEAKMKVVREKVGVNLY